MTKKENQFTFRAIRMYFYTYCQWKYRWFISVDAGEFDDKRQTSFGDCLDKIVSVTQPDENNEQYLEANVSGSLLNF